MRRLSEYREAEERLPFFAQKGTVLLITVAVICVDFFLLLAAAGAIMSGYAAFLTAVAATFLICVLPQIPVQHVWLSETAACRLLLLTAGLTLGTLLALLCVMNIHADAIQASHVQNFLSQAPAEPAEEPNTVLIRVLSMLLPASSAVLLFALRTYRKTARHRGVVTHDGTVVVDVMTDEMTPVGRRRSR